MTKNVTFPNFVAGGKILYCTHLQTVISLFPMSHILTVPSHLPVFVMNVMNDEASANENVEQKQQMVLEEH